MISRPPRPLMEIVAEIEDPRAARGRRHSLGAILGLVCVATLCGYRSYSAMAEWGHNYGGEIMTRLGFGHAPPCAATLHRVLRDLDRAQVERAVGAWAQGVLAALLRENGVEAIAIDGKRLRGSYKQGAPCTHVLSAVSQRLGLTLTQEGVARKTNEITAVQRVLRGLVLEGRVVTVDALLTQRAIARTIVERGGAYVMVAKDNQAGLRKAIAGLLITPASVPGVSPVRQATTVNRGHGRQEERTLRVRTLLPGDCDWPGAQGVFQITRRRTRLRTGEASHESIEGVTSLSEDAASPEALLHVLRGHWHIENKVHGIHDVTFDEDRSPVRCGSIPHVMAVLRATMIGLVHLSGSTNVAATCRRHAAQPWRALALIGLARE